MVWPSTPRTMHCPSRVTCTVPGQTGSESSVGYVDNAIPTDQVRLRSDAAWRNNAPDRAEYFYARLQRPGDLQRGGEHVGDAAGEQLVQRGEGERAGQRQRRVGLQETAQDQLVPVGHDTAGRAGAGHCRV